MMDDFSIENQGPFIVKIRVTVLNVRLIDQEILDVDLLVLGCLKCN